MSSGLNSTFVYDGGSDFIKALVTPYGTDVLHSRARRTTRASWRRIYPDGSRDRVEFNQFSSPASRVTHPAVSLFRSGWPPPTLS